MSLEQVGWLFWHEYNPEAKEFTRVALTEGDMRNGYRAVPVYTNPSDFVVGAA